MPPWLGRGTASEPATGGALKSRLGVADDPAHRSPVKVALSKAQYVHSMLLGGR